MKSKKKRRMKNKEKETFIQTNEDEMSLKSRNRIDNRMTIDGIEYRLQRIIDATATNIHHIISRKEKQEFNVHADRNKMEINMRVHDALNKLYWDKQNPKKQLEFMFNIRKPVLSPGVKMALLDILSLPNDVFYHQELIKWPKHKNKKSEMNSKNSQKE